MRLYVDNLDGQGMVDWTAQILRDAPLKVVRALNAVARCTVGVVLRSGVTALQDRARALVTDSTGHAVFTGFLCSQTVRGSVDRSVLLEALSDEWLMDNSGDALELPVLGGSVADAMQQVCAAGGGAYISADSVSSSNALGVAGATSQVFSAALGERASTGGVAYRVLGGSVSVAPIGGAVHPLGEAIVSQTIKLRAERANDVTVTGEMEPGTHMTEVFAGDGVTDTFTLLHRPFAVAEPVLVDSTFAVDGLNATVWAVAGSSRLTAGASGLSCSGGTGTDGATYLALRSPIEIGGVIVAELRDVVPGNVGEGVLCGFYNGSVLLGDCFAGIRLRSVAGVLTAFAVVLDAEVGSGVTVSVGHRYSMRTRLFADEAYRQQQIFYSGGAAFGGGTIASAVRVVCELRDEGLASNTATTVLCDQVMTATPVQCVFAPVSSISLSVGVAAASVMRALLAEVRVTSSGVDGMRLIGDAVDGCDCEVVSTGVVRFYDGRVPAPGDVVLVRYRVKAASSGRVQDAADMAAVQALALPAAQRWQGRVRMPVARTSADCLHAAQALLHVATDANAALQGTCVVIRSADGDDIWPGDAVQLADGSTCMVQQIAMTDGQTVPEVIHSALDLANAWAEPASMQLTQEMLADIPLGLYADELSALQVTGVTALQINVDTGVDAPSAGGFEVRRRDEGFRDGTDGDLVLRSSARVFTIPRAMQQESYAVRMYDGSTPRRYSRYSSVVAVTVPMG